MPNRILRDCTDSEKINKLSVHAERFFYRLIMKVDSVDLFIAYAFLEHQNKDFVTQEVKSKAWRDAKIEYFEKLNNMKLDQSDKYLCLKAIVTNPTVLRMAKAKCVEEYFKQLKTITT